MRILVLALFVACSGTKADQPDSFARCQKAIREFYATGHYFRFESSRKVIEAEYAGQVADSLCGTPGDGPGYSQAPLWPH